MHHAEQILVIMGMFTIIIGICLLYNCINKFWKRRKNKNETK